MSKLIVDVCAVEEIAVHPSADRIERVRVKNWWCIAGKGQYKVGDKVLYVPPDAVLPEALAERWGIAKYCCQLGKVNGERPPGLRVKASRFRGVSSFGTIQNLDDPTLEIGTDLQEYYGIVKYEPPIKSTDGDADAPISAFHTYTSIEALGNYPNMLNINEEVIVTEKIHGSNSRVGIVNLPDPDMGDFDWVFTAGSHDVRRKEFNDKGQISKYWMPLYIRQDLQPTPMMQMLFDIVSEENATSSVIVFGEIFGVGIQDMTYGKNSLSYRIFDISVDQNYLDYDKMENYVKKYNEFGLELAPVLYRGPYLLAKMDELVDGPTTICNADEIKEIFKGREGIVIRPTTERYDPIVGSRTILKYVSADYHDRKNKNTTEDH